MPTKQFPLIKSFMQLDVEFNNNVSAWEVIKV